jgi:hypothetical protein
LKKQIANLKRSGQEIHDQDAVELLDVDWRMLRTCSRIELNGPMIKPSDLTLASRFFQI